MIKGIYQEVRKEGLPHVISVLYGEAKFQLGLYQDRKAAERRWHDEAERLQDIFAAGNPVYAASLARSRIIDRFECVTLALAVALGITLTYGELNRMATKIKDVPSVSGSLDEKFNGESEVVGNLKIGRTNFPP